MNSELSAITKLIRSLFPLLLVACQQQHISGSYVQHSEHAAILLEIEESQNKHLIGSCHLTILNTNGRIQQLNWLIDGVIKGRQITMQAKPENQPEEIISIGGILVDGGIELAFPATPASVTAGLQRLSSGSHSDYDGAVRDLRLHSALILKSGSIRRHSGHTSKQSAS